MTSEDMKPTPEDQLESCLRRWDPEDQKLIRALRAALRTRLPTANELAYDYGSSFVMAYSPTDRGIDGILSLAARADGLRLYLMNGPQLPDPRGLLQGSGKQARFVRLEGAGQVADPDVEALIVAAIDRAVVPLPSEGQGRLIIKKTAAGARGAPL